MSHTGKQIFTIETIKFGQLLEYNVRNIRLVPDLFLLFKKSLYKVKTSGQ